MKAKVLETNMPLIMYLNNVKDGIISDDQDVQRMFCSDNSFINGIGVTVLTEDYLPPIILCDVPYDDGTKQTYIADGGQRTAALMLIRYGHHKFTSSTEDSEIEYQSKKTDKNGNVCKDDDGRIIWEKKVFDIKNKTFDDFPQELKDKFDVFQLKIATHPDCSIEQVSKYVRRYNNHKSMNTSQKALTYLDKFARKVKNISQNNFFKNCMKPSDTERKNGTYEKLICESVMTVFHLDDWKKAPKQMNIYLNDHSKIEEFDYVNESLREIEGVCRDEYQEIFVPKNIAVWVSAYSVFKNTGKDIIKFVRFLDEFKNSLHSMVIDGSSWDDLDSKQGTKDKSVITGKVNILSKLLFDFLKVNEEDLENTYKDDSDDLLKFVRENVDASTTSEDIDDYYSMLDEYNIDKKSNLLDWKNEKSLVAIIAYSFKQDIDLDNWLPDYFNRAATYDEDQKKNYLHMKNDLTRYLQQKAV